MTHSGTDVAHIECLQVGGQCGASNLTVQDDTTSLPFFLYTGGIPYLDNVTCWGKTDRTSGSAPVNDCVWFGNGTSYTCSNGGLSGSPSDGVCDYGNTAHINIFVQSIKRALVFGSNANAIEAYVTANYSDANIDSMLNPIGGLVEFNADTGHPAYGNRVHILSAEMGPSGGGHCNYKGAVRFVQGLRHPQPRRRPPRNRSGQRPVRRGAAPAGER